MRARAAFLRFQRRRQPEDFTPVFEDTAPLLFKTALVLTHDPHTAEDLVQNTYIEVIRKPDRFDATRDLNAWMVGILLNQARMHHRGSRRRHERVQAVAREMDPKDGSLDESPIEDASCAEVRVSVETAVASLGEPYREVVRLHLLEGRQGEEVAELLGRRPSTVRTQLSRGLDELRRKLPAGLAGATAGVLLVREAVARAAVRLEQAMVETAATTADENGATHAADGAATTLSRTHMRVAASLGVAALLGAGSFGLLWLTNDPGGIPAGASMAGDVRPTVGAATPTSTAAPVARTAIDGPSSPKWAVRVRATSGAEATPVVGLALRLLHDSPDATSWFDSYPDGAHDSRTDEAGLARFDDVPNGVYQVCTDGGSNPVRRIEVAGELEVTISVAAFSEVDGTVRDTTGTPIADATIWCCTVSSINLPPLQVATTDATGGFKASVLASGTLLWPEHPGFATAMRKGTRMKRGRMDLSWVLQRAEASITGRVVETFGRAPVRDALIVLYELAHPRLPHRFGRTDDAGHFAFHGIRNGLHAVVVRGEVLGLRCIDVTEQPSGVTDIVVEVGHSATLLSRCVRQDGRPWNEGIVRASPILEDNPAAVIAAARRRAHINEKGEATLTGLTPGRWRLMAMVGKLKFPFWEPRTATDNVVTLAAGSATEQVIVVGDPPTMAGRVVDEEGDPYPGVRVGVAPASVDVGQMPMAMAWSKSDEEGSFEVPIQCPGEHVLVAGKWAGLLSAPPVWQRVGAREQPEIVVPRSAARTASLTARLVNSAGKPVAGGTLLLRRPGLTAFRDSRPTDATGLVSMRRLSPGPYEVFARSRRQGLTHVADIELGAENNGLGEIRLGRGCSLIVRLNLPEDVPSDECVVEVHEPKSGKFFRVRQVDASRKNWLGPQWQTLLKEGAWVRSSLPPGPVTVLVSGPGVAPLKRELTLKPGAPNALELRAEPAPTISINVEVHAANSNPGELLLVHVFTSSGGRLLRRVVPVAPTMRSVLRIGLPDGSYDCQVISARGAFWRSTLTVPSTEPPVFARR